MSFNFSQFVSWRTIQYRSHSLIHFTPERDWLGRKEYSLVLLLSNRTQWLKSLISEFWVSPHFRSQVFLHLFQNSKLGPNHHFAGANALLIEFSSSYLTWESSFISSPFVRSSFVYCATGCSALSSNLIPRSLDTKFTGLEDDVVDGAVELLVCLIDTKFLTGFDLAT